MEHNTSLTLNHLLAYILAISCKMSSIQRAFFFFAFTLSSSVPTYARPFVPRPFLSKYFSPLHFPKLVSSALTFPEGPAGQTSNYGQQQMQMSNVSPVAVCMM